MLVSSVCCVSSVVLAFAVCCDVCCGLAVRLSCVVQLLGRRGVMLGCSLALAVLLLSRRRPKGGKVWQRPKAADAHRVAAGLPLTDPGPGLRGGRSAVMRSRHFAGPVQSSFRWQLFASAPSEARPRGTLHTLDFLCGCHGPCVCATRPAP